MSIGTILLDWLGWVGELAASGAIVIASLAAALVLLLVLRRMWRWAALWSIAAIATGGLYFFSIVDALPMTDAGAHPLRVVTANVYGANHNFTNIVDWASAGEADLLVFEEVSGSAQDALAPLEDVYPYSHRQLGFYIFSRYAISSVERLHLVDGAQDELRFQLAAPGGPVTVIAVHFISPKSFVDLEIRNTQLENLAALAREINGDLIVLGDLNTSTSSPAFLRLLHDGQLSHPQVPIYFGTWPTAFPVIQIDHVLVGGDLAYRSVESLELPGSDHQALAVEILRD